MDERKLRIWLLLEVRLYKMERPRPGPVPLRIREEKDGGHVANPPSTQREEVRDGYEEDDHSDILRCDRD